jgi:hypothetical protein
MLALGGRHRSSGERMIIGEIHEVAAGIGGADATAHSTVSVPTIPAITCGSHWKKYDPGARSTTRSQVALGAVR